MGSLSLALTCLLVGAGEYGVLADRVIAVVGEEVLTESELLIEARVALAFREGGEVATQPLESELLESLRDYVVNQLVVMVHAGRLGMSKVKKAKGEALMKEFRGKFRSRVAYESFLRRYGILESTVERILLRDYRNDRFIEQRFGVNPVGSSGKSSGQEVGVLAQWLKKLKRSVPIRLSGREGRLELQ